MQKSTSLRECASFELLCHRLRHRVRAVHVSEKQKKRKKGTRALYFKYMSGYHCRPIATITGTVRGIGDIIIHIFFVDWFNRFRSRRGRYYGSPIGTANGDYHIGLRYRAAMWSTFAHIWSKHIRNSPALHAEYRLFTNSERHWVETERLNSIARKFFADSRRLP